MLRPDGLPGIYGVVHFKNRAVGVLARRRRRVGLAGRPVSLSPRARIRGRSPREAAPRPSLPKRRPVRELREETGLSAGRLELVATAHLSNSVSDELGYVFRATELTQGADEPEGTERLLARRFAWDEAWAMLKRGEITDSLSVIALLHEAVRRLERS